MLTRHLESTLAMLLLLTPTALWAQSVNEAEALKQAKHFLLSSTNQHAQATGLRGSKRDIHLILVKEGRMPVSQQPAYYVFASDEEQGGFVIVSGDERTSHRILGYATSGSFPTDEMPENMQTWLEGYAEQIEVLQTSSTVAADAGSSEPVGTIVIAPLVSTQWDQGDDFATKTPKVSGEHTPVGCVPVATAQIMNYYRWPKQGTGSIEYEWRNSYLDRDFADCTYNWDDLDVAQLLSDVGIACQTNYDPTGSSALDREAGYALITHFGYDKGMEYHFRSSLGQWDADAWDDMLRAELDAHRPVYYSGVQKKGRTSTGHAFVCDGYDDAGYFHFNFGWSGQGDGWYLTSAVNPDDEVYGYNNDQAVITHIMPDTGGQPWLGAVAMQNGVGDGYFWALTNAKMEATTCYENAATGEKLYANIVTFDLDPNKCISLGYTFPEGDNDYTISYADGREEHYQRVNLTDGTFKKYRVFRLQGMDEWQTYDCNYGHQYGDGQRETFVWVDVKGNEWTVSSSLNFKDDLYAYRLFNDSEVYICGLQQTPGASVTIPSKAAYRGVEYSVVGVCDLYLDQTSELVLPEGLRFIGNETIGGIGGFNGTSLTLPATLEKIGQNGIHDCPNLSTLIIPASMKTLGKAALKGNEGLKTVTFADGSQLTVLPENCFEACKRLKSITLPTSLERMEASCFYQCGSLKEIAIPASVRLIGQAVFSGCTNLEHIAFAEDSQLETIDGGFSEYEGTFYGTENLEHISFPPSLKVMKDGFQNCGIKYADFSRTQMTVLGKEDQVTFNRCHGLETVLLPPTIRKIGMLFQDCENVTSFIIPKGTEEILNLGCTNIQSLVIPTSVKTFDGLECDSSTVVICEGMTPPAGEGLADYIYGRAFKKFTLYVPAGALQTYQNYEYLDSRYNHPYRIMTPIYEMAGETTANVVADADAATVMGGAAEGNVVLPAAVNGSEGEVPVTAIADYAFMGNGTVTSVDIPSSVGSGEAKANALRNKAMATTSGIGQQAFAYCMNMDTVHVHWTEPLPVSADVFEGINLATLTLIVPDGTTDFYAATDVWKEFGTIVEEYVATIDTPTIDANANTNVYNLLGQPVDNAYQGIVIKDGKKVLQLMHP